MPLQTDQVIVLYRGETHVAKTVAGGVVTLCRRHYLVKSYSVAPQDVDATCRVCRTATLGQRPA